MTKQTWIDWFVFATLALMVGLTSHSDAQVGLNRKILLQQDLDIPGYVSILAEAYIAVRGREGRD